MILPLMDTALLYTWLFFKKDINYVATSSPLTTLVFISKHSFKISVIYDYLEMIVVIEENASFYDARLGFIDGNHSLATGGNIVCSNLHGRTVKRETKEGIEMKIKIGFNPRCVVYANVIGVTFNATNGTNIYLKYAELFEKIADEKHSCDQSSF
ncbi:hypothetical protein QTN25_004605 [Entamoeba marina]